MDEVQLTGLSAVLKKLSQLEPRQTKAIVVKAVREGNAVFARAVSALAPVAAKAPSKRSTALTQGFLRVDITSRVSASQEGAVVGTVFPGKVSRHVAQWVVEGHRKVAGSHTNAKGISKGGRSFLRRNGTTRGPGTASGTTEPNAFVDEAFRKAAETAYETVEDSILGSLKSKGVI